ncbi:MAG TPA: alanine racemase [Burkholderiales bacterium]|nr:alanine racemase [Burkholderiales bacterium]
MPRPILATIDAAALRHNLAVARRHAPRSRVLAVIKANAYGHGLERAARALAEADGFALLELEAAVALRAAGYRQRIALLAGCFEARELAAVVEHRLALVVHNREQLAMLEALPAGAGLEVLAKVDTGMNRLGFSPGELGSVLRSLGANPGVGGITLMTHFASAEEPRGVDWQLQVFEAAARGTGLPRSLANSAAILRYPETHADWVRPGIMLYGCSPFPGQCGADLGLRPAMTLESRIIAVRELKPGDGVGYGGEFRAQRAMRIGVVACGYADGYPRHAPTGTPVMVEGRLTRTLGRVSMDMLCVDLDGVPGARIGSRVVLWGEGVPVERVAAAAGTIGYELLCGLAPRVPVIERE